MKKYNQVEGILHNYKYLQIEIEKIDCELESLLSNETYGLSGVSYDDMPKSHNISSTVENNIINKERQISKLIHDKRKKEIEKKQIDVTLDTLDNDLKMIFDEYYNKSGRKNIQNLCYRKNISRGKFYSDKDKLVEVFRQIL